MLIYTTTWVDLESKHRLYDSTHGAVLRGSGKVAATWDGENEFCWVGSSRDGCVNSSPACE